MNLAWMGKRVHYTLSNLPLEEWYAGKTLCRRKGQLFRIGRETRVLKVQMCAQCVREFESEPGLAKIDRERAAESTPFSDAET